MKKRFLRKAMTMFLAVALVFTGLPMNFVVATDTLGTAGTTNVGAAPAAPVTTPDPAAPAVPVTTPDPAAPAVPVTTPDPAAPAAPVTTPDPAAPAAPVTSTGATESNPIIATEEPEHEALEGEYQVEYGTDNLTLDVADEDSVSMAPMMLMRSMAPERETRVMSPLWKDYYVSSEGYGNVIDSKSEVVDGSVLLSKNAKLTIKVNPEYAPYFLGWYVGDSYKNSNETFEISYKNTPAGSNITAKFMTKEEIRFNQDKAKISNEIGSFDRENAFNKHGLNVKAYELRYRGAFVPDKDDKQGNLPTSFDNAVDLYGKAKSESIILRAPREIHNNQGFSLTNGSNSLYWYYDSLKVSEKPYNQIVNIWGFLVPSESGTYHIGIESDDGSYGTIQAIGSDEVRTISNTGLYNDADRVNSGYAEDYKLKAGKIYRIQIRTFENCPTNSQFKLIMKGKWDWNWSEIPNEWLYPSLNTQDPLFQMDPITVTSKPEKAVAGSFSVEGTAQKNSDLVVKIKQEGAEDLVKEVAVDDAGKWAVVLSSDEMQNFFDSKENGKISLNFEYKNGDGKAGPVDVEYDTEKDFVVTADNRYKLYVDGNLLYDNTADALNPVVTELGKTMLIKQKAKSEVYGWDYAERYKLKLEAGKKHVIAIEGLNVESISGIKADLSFNGANYVTGDTNNWKIANEATEGWNKVSFNDSTWSAPKIYEANDWNTLKNFAKASSAQWVWSEGGNTNPNQSVFLRLTVGQVPTNVAIEGKKDLKVPYALDFENPELTTLLEGYTGKVLDQDGVPMAFEASKLSLKSSSTVYPLNADGKVTLTPASPAGTFVVSSDYNGVSLPTKEPFNVVVNKDASLPTHLKIFGLNTLTVPEVVADGIGGYRIAKVEGSYSSKAFDQYGVACEDRINRNIKLTLEKPNTPDPKDVAISYNRNAGAIKVTSNSLEGRVIARALLTVHNGELEYVIRTEKNETETPFTVQVVRPEPVAHHVVLTGSDSVMLNYDGNLSYSEKAFEGKIYDQYNKVMKKASLSLDKGELGNIQFAVSKGNKGNKGKLQVDSYPNAKAGVVTVFAEGYRELPGGTKNVNIKKFEYSPVSLSLTKDAEPEVFEVPADDSATLINFVAAAKNAYDDPVPAAIANNSFFGFAKNENPSKAALTIDKKSIVELKDKETATLTVLANAGTGDFAVEKEMKVTIKRLPFEPVVAFVNGDGYLYTEDQGISIPGHYPQNEPNVLRIFKGVINNQYGERQKGISPTVSTSELPQNVEWNAATGTLTVKPHAVQTKEAPIVISGSYMLHEPAARMVSEEPSVKGDVRVNLYYGESRKFIRVNGEQKISIEADATSSNQYNFDILNKYEEKVKPFGQMTWTVEPLNSLLLAKEIKISNGLLTVDKELPSGMYNVRISVAMGAPIYEKSDVPKLAAFKDNLPMTDMDVPAPIRSKVIATGTLDIEITKKAVTPVTPPTPQPQPQTRGERGDRGTTFANVIIADELTPLGAVKFNNAYMVGYPNKTFKPTAVMTRGEAAAVFANVLGLNKNLKTGVKFTDVSVKNWNYGAIQASVKVGLLTTKDGKFNPDAPVTRGDMAAAFAKFWELNNIKVSDATTKTTDITGHWAEKQINQTINAKLMAAFDDNTFKPDSAVTREQTAVMFNKLIARAKIAKTKPSFKDVSLDYWAAGDIEAAVMKMNILGK